MNGLWLQGPRLGRPLGWAPGAPSRPCDAAPAAPGSRRPVCRRPCSWPDPGPPCSALVVVAEPGDDVAQRGELCGDRVAAAAEAVTSA